MVDLIRILKDRFNRVGLYNTPAYWSKHVTEREGLAISLWPNNDYNTLCHRDLLKELEVLGDMEGKRILDLGCGIGRLSRVFVEKGAVVIGADFSSEVIEHARAKNDYPRLSYKVLSVFDLEDDNAYDLVVTCACLVVACKDIRELNDIFHRINRSLSPGGEVFLMEPVHRGFLRRVLDASEGQFSRAIEKSGFDLLSRRHLYFIPSRLVICNISFPKWVTTMFYNVGEWLLRVCFRNKIFGDYIIFHAKKRRSV